MKPEQRFFIEFQQPLPGGTDLAIFFRALTMLFNWHACPFSQIEQCLTEVKALLFLYETEDITTFITAKAMPSLSLSENVKRRSTLIVKWAKPLERLSCSL